MPRTDEARRRPTLLDELAFRHRDQPVAEAARHAQFKGSSSYLDRASIFRSNGLTAPAIDVVPGLGSRIDLRASPEGSGREGAMFHRRKALAGLAGLVAHQALVSPASAQAALLGKIPWKTIVEGIAAAVTALDIWMKIRPDGAERKDTACALAMSDVTIVNRMCRQLALATNTREFEASVEPGDGGLLAALQDYVATPNRSNWLRVRNAAIRFLTDAGDLFKELSKPGGLVEKLDAEPQAAILARLRQALIEIEPSLQLLHYDRREPSSSDRGAAAEILDRLFGLPKLLDEAVRASQDLVARRSTANCK